MLIATPLPAQQLRGLAARILPAAAAAALLAGPARASIVYVSQSRSISVSGTALSTVEAGASPADFGLFNRTVSFTDPIEGHGGSAQQRSELLGDRLLVSTQFSARDGRSGFSAAAASVLDVQFSLAETTSMLITGGWSMFTATTGVSLSGEARLSRLGAILWTAPLAAQFPTTEMVPIGLDAVLPPGTYRFEVRSTLEANVIPGFTTGSAMVNAALWVPSPPAATGFMGGTLLLAGLRRRGRPSPLNR